MRNEYFSDYAIDERNIGIVIDWSLTQVINNLAQGPRLHQHCEGMGFNLRIAESTSLRTAD
jgi:hypothetical protein